MVQLSHIVGIVKTGPNPAIGPNSGPSSCQNTWTFELPSSPELETIFLILHFTNAKLPGNNCVEVFLGYTLQSSTGDRLLDPPYQYISFNWTACHYQVPHRLGLSLATTTWHPYRDPSRIGPNSTARNALDHPAYNRALNTTET